MVAMPFCVDCRYFKRANGSANIVQTLSQCRLPATATNNPVDGLPSYPYAADARSVRGACGPSGARFEPRAEQPEEGQK